MLRGIYTKANESFGRHGIFWAFLLWFVAPGSASALMAWLFSHLGWFWDDFRWAGVAAVFIITWMALGVTLASWRIFPLRRYRRLNRQAARFAAPLIPDVVPDWTIRELFFYLRPEGFENQADKEAIGREVIDKLSSGQFMAWGKLIEDSRRLALAKIESVEWQRANFGPYWFLDAGEGNREALHAICESATRGAAPHHYADLRVVRAVAETLWPNDLVPLQAAARIAYEAVEEAGITTSVVGVPYSSPDVALDHFKYVLLLSRVELIGVRPPSSKPRLIAHEEIAGLRPVSGESILKYRIASAGTAYVDVTIRRRALMNAIYNHIEALKREQIRLGLTS